MSEKLRTLSSNECMALIMVSEEGNTGCILPRYDAYLFSQAMKESLLKNCSIHFETGQVSIDILNMDGSFMIDCSDSSNNICFQLGISDGERAYLELEASSLRAKKMFGPPPKLSNWTYFDNTIKESAQNF
jgi:hypothetical protein